MNAAVHPVFAPYAPNFDDQMQVVLDEKVPIFSFTFGILDEVWVRELKAEGVLLIGTATTLQEACALEKAGIDMIALQGSEAGGHRGTFFDTPENSLISLPNLLAKSVEHIRVPIIVSGGVMDGQAIIAALASGADAVQMGAAF